MRRDPCSCGFAAPFQETRLPNGIIQSVEYVYDSQNRWIAKSVDPDGDGPQEATDTHFVYQGNQIILQIDGEGEVTNRYLWGPAVDQILADEQVQPDGSSEVLWTLTDHLNTVRDLADYDPVTDVTTVVNHIVYDAFGWVTAQSDPSVTTLFGFTARPFDADTGLQNNLNRWYDAETETWISVDPMGFGRPRHEPLPLCREPVDHHIGSERARLLLGLLVLLDASQADGQRHKDCAEHGAGGGWCRSRNGCRDRRRSGCRSWNGD